jgi:hypothetical protein
MLVRKLVHALVGSVVVCALSTVLPGCSSESEPLVIAPHAIAIAADPSYGGSVVLLSDVPLSCADAQYLKGGAPPGARFKAVLRVRAWKAGAIESSADAALFDEEGLLSVSARGRVDELWGTFTLLDAPRAKGAVARLRASAQGTFAVTDHRPVLEEYSIYRVTFGEPEQRPFSFSGEVDVTICSDLVDAK